MSDRIPDEVWTHVYANDESSSSWLSFLLMMIAFGVGIYYYNHQHHRHKHQQQQHDVGQALSDEERRLQRERRALAASRRRMEDSMVVEVDSVDDADQSLPMNNDKEQRRSIEMTQSMETTMPHATDSEIDSLIPAALLDHQDQHSRGQTPTTGSCGRSELSTPKVKGLGVEDNENPIDASKLQRKRQLHERALKGHPTASNDAVKETIISATLNLDEKGQHQIGVKVKDALSTEKSNQSKKKRTAMLPKQQLIQAFQHVTHSFVTLSITTSEEEQLRLPQPGGTTLLLRLEPNHDEDWDALIHALALALQEQLNAFALKTVRQAVQWHARSETIQRQGMVPVVKESPELRKAMQLVSKVVVQQVVMWMSTNLDDEEVEPDDDEEDLFSEEYTHHDGEKIEMNDSINQLIDLLEETPTVVSNQFLNDLVLVYREQPDVTDPMRLPMVLWQRVLSRIGRTPMSFSSLLHCRLSAVTHLLTSKFATALQSAVQDEACRVSDKSGRQVEELLCLRPLLSMAAYTLPEAGMESPSARSKGRFQEQLEQEQDYPMNVFRSGEVTQVMEESRNTMRAASRVAESTLKKVFATKEKQKAFGWLSMIVQSNDALVNMLMGDLLAADGVAAVSSTRAFLLGLTSSLVNLCSQPLLDRFDKDGADAFEIEYLIEDGKGGGRLGIAKEESRLIPGDDREILAVVIPKFAGATEFFFLTGALLRVGLYPALRVMDEFLLRYNEVLTTVQSVSKSSEPASPELLRVAKPAVAAWLGWTTFMEDTEFAASVTKFGLLQLQWLLSVAKSSPDQLQLIPEWMCKQPANWLARVARHMPRVLRPDQSGAAVECATELLQISTVTRAGSDGRSMFSPVVVTELIHIASSFVSAGVNRAKRKQRVRQRRPFGSSDDPDHDEADEDDDDDRNLDIYLSFDQNDLGVTVFTNKLVSTQLCPTLIQTFSALDIVEGLDVDREYGFDKFQVKIEIADLLLRLWSHPSEECRQSIVRLPGANISRFVSSVAAAIGYLLDDACHRLSDVCSLSKRTQGLLSRSDEQFISSQSRGATNGLRMARCLLLLLCTFSQEQAIAQVLGGRGKVEQASKQSSVWSHLSTMILHFVDKLTALDGGVHPDLDLRKTTVSSTIVAQRIPAMTVQETEDLVTELIQARYVARYEYGLDASVLCHQFLVLATCWHHAAKQVSDGQNGISPILMSLASNDDCDVLRLRNIYRRLVVQRPPFNVSEYRDAHVVFEMDGHVLVDTSNVMKKSMEASTAENRDRRRQARRDQMKHEELDTVASLDSISSFLDDLDAAISSKAHVDQTNIVSSKELQQIQEDILSGGATLGEDDYTKKLGEWVVSSAPFQSQHGKETFSHYYDATARSRGLCGSGKGLVKEARKCHKTLPAPHPNSASFVCFAEERMDLCRAVITGPVDTPYAHGLFVFDVYFPPTYPHIPPLLTLMTTGGGQTRFNPNLYQDGKVCLSLLGTWHATDESERWNPDVSSLAQVLLSIQTQLLVSEPYFNEPGYERTKGTQAGNEGSTRYNSSLRLATLRHAIIGQLREPPKGFEEVAIRHFATCRKRILVQARRWTEEARGSSTYTRFERAYGELLTLLSTEKMKCYDALDPLAEDCRALEALGVNMSHSLERVNAENDDDDRKCAPVVYDQQYEQETHGHPVSHESVNATTYNPWASPHPSLILGLSSLRHEDECDSDDDFYS